MPEQNRCPQCGRPMAPDSPQGLCPGCLLKRGLEPNTVDFTAGQGPTARWTPPAPQELAAAFPELEILELIGRGGMGAVYKARQKNLDRVVALKILPPEIGRDPAFAQRFAREAQALARLSHPHIVAIHDFGQRGGVAGVPPARGEGVSPSGAGLFFFLMEYVDGLSLRQLLDSGNVSPKEALAIVPQICDALQFAHDQGIVHRDIKPENILLDRRGNVKIADFGLAKLVGRSTGVPPVSTTAVSAVEDTARHGQDARDTHGQDAHATQQAMGTPQYMAPEQVERPAEVDHRTDIYSLGVVFYQMLTGELPLGRFEPPSHKVLIDVRLDEVVLRALEKEPARRYQQASEVKTQVETIVATQAIGSQPPRGQVETPPTPQHWKWMSNEWIPVRPWHKLVVVTGMRGGKRVVNGQAALFWFAVGGVMMLMGFLLAQGGGRDAQMLGSLICGWGIALLGAPIFGWVTLNLWAPERLVPLDEPGAPATPLLVESPPTPQHWKWMSNEWIPVRPWHRFVVVTGMRGGKRVINWPAALRWFAVAILVMLIGSLLLPGSGTGSQTLGALLIGVGAGTLWGVIWGMVLLNFWARERLVPLDDPPPAAGSGTIEEGPQGAGTPSPHRRRWRKAVLNLAILVLAILFVRTFVLEEFHAESDAVAPEITKGSRIFVYKLNREWQTGDILVYRRDGTAKLGRFLEGGPGGTFLIERKAQSPQAIARADVIGKVVFNTRSAANSAQPATQAAGRAGDRTAPTRP